MANQWITNNKEKWNEYCRNRSKNNRNFSISKTKHVIIRRVIKGIRTNSPTLFKLLGVKDREEMLSKLISTLPENTSLDNYRRNHEDPIELDLIKPACSFNLSNVDELHECFNISNIRFIRVMDNKHKGKKEIKLKPQDFKYSIIGFFMNDPFMSAGVFVSHNDHGVIFGEEGKVFDDIVSAEDYRCKLETEYPDYILFVVKLNDTLVFKTKKTQIVGES